jgi:hypothetical protein
MLAVLAGLLCAGELLAQMASGILMLAKSWHELVLKVCWRGWQRFRVLV